MTILKTIMLLSAFLVSTCSFDVSGMKRTFDEIDRIEEEEDDNEEKIDLEKIEKNTGFKRAIKEHNEYRSLLNQQREQCVIEVNILLQLPLSKTGPLLTCFSDTIILLKKFLVKLELDTLVESIDDYNEKVIKFFKEQSSDKSFEEFILVLTSKLTKEMETIQSSFTREVGNDFKPLLKKLSKKDVIEIIDICLKQAKELKKISDSLDWTISSLQLDGSIVFLSAIKKCIESDDNDNLDDTAIHLLTGMLSNIKI